ncbi:MAG: ArsA family ATPase [Polyangiaceae bacterium]
MSPLENRRFLFITGKGGVGKTTVTAALAARLAAQGKRVLITACDAKERISTLFGADPMSPEVRPLAQGVWGVKLTPEVALREYGGMILKSQAVYGAVFDNNYVRSFFAGVPGLFEWAMLGKAWFHSTELMEDGRHRFDIVLFDAPATGHGLDMLRVPKIIVEVVPPGVLRRDAERAWQMFQDPTATGVVVVTIPEEMPTNETLELLEALDQELDLPVAHVVINAVIPTLFSDDERTELLEDRTLNKELPGTAAVACGVRRAIRERVQERALARLREVAHPRVELPWLPGDATTPAAVKTLADIIIARN